MTERSRHDIRSCRSRSGVSHLLEPGAAGEDWDTWCDTCFTEDVTYVEHILENKQGRETVRAWIKPTMADYVDQCKKFDPDFRHRRTRRNWGNGPAWTQGAATYAESLGARRS